MLPLVGLRHTEKVHPDELVRRVREDLLHMRQLAVVLVVGVHFCRVQTWRIPPVRREMETVDAEEFAARAVAMLQGWEELLQWLTATVHRK